MYNMNIYYTCHWEHKGLIRKFRLTHTRARASTHSGHTRVAATALVVAMHCAHEAHIYRRARRAQVWLVVSCQSVDLLVGGYVVAT